MTEQCSLVLAGLIRHSNQHLARDMQIISKIYTRDAAVVLQRLSNLVDTGTGELIC